MSKPFTDREARIIAAAKAAGVDEHGPDELPPHELFDRVRTAVPDVSIDEVINVLERSAAAAQQEADELRRFARTKWPFTPSTQ